MTEPTPEMLADLLGGVIQDTAFVFADPAEEPASWEGPVLVARIAFESTRSGTLRLATTMPAAAEIAANMLGVDPGTPEADDQARAAVSELLNVIGGAFITRYFGSEVPSQLGLPATDLCAAPPPARRTCVTAARLESGEPLVLELDIGER